MAIWTRKPPLVAKLLDILVIGIPYKLVLHPLEWYLTHFGTNYKISYNMHYFAILSALISVCAISFAFSNCGVSEFSFTNLWHSCKPMMFCQSCPINNGLVPLEIHSMFVSVWLRLWCICKIEEGLGGHEGHLLVAISTTPPLQDPPKANDAKSTYTT